MKYIYKLTNQVNQKCYIGQTYKPSQRKAQHFLEGSRDKSDHPLYRSMRKHGIENFTFEIIEECEDENTDERECFWIAELNSRNTEKGYNIDIGGKGTKKEHRRTLSEALKGNKHCVGRVFSEETRQKIGEKSAERVVSGSTREKLSNSLVGKFAGPANPMFGKLGHAHPRSRVTPEKLKKAKQLIAEGQTNKFISRELGVSSSTISRIRSGHTYA